MASKKLFMPLSLKNIDDFEKWLHKLKSGNVLLALIKRSKGLQFIFL